MHNHLIARLALVAVAASLAVASESEVANAAPVAPQARRHLTAAARAGLTLPHAAVRLPGTRTFLRASWR